MRGIKKAGLLNVIAVCILTLGMLLIVVGVLYIPSADTSPPNDWKGLSFSAANKIETAVYSVNAPFSGDVADWAYAGTSAMYRLGIIPHSLIERIINGDSIRSESNSVTVFEFTELIGNVTSEFAATPEGYASMAAYLRSQLAADYLSISQEQNTITRTEAAQIILSALRITGEDWGSISPEEISGNQMPDDVTLNTISKIYDNEIMIGYGDSYFGKSLKNKFTIDEALTATYNYYRYKARVAGGYYD